MKVLLTLGFIIGSSFGIPYPFPIQTSTPGPIVVVTPVPVYVSPDSHFKSQMDVFSSSSNTGTNFDNRQFGNNFLNGKYSLQAQLVHPQDLTIFPHPDPPIIKKHLQGKISLL
ncbi:unnamed protein product [Lepeophtheirus salmonis]|uniref:(salmon louse) hypothetical protein n=1 Tax=Lepeophtheirus salmonis TaxID=72036 RepID=A0A7R8CPA1_LEPSM|nr:unnamed protein product [Lepeophtheirus salmonis]CAF2851503.1 unnamed protein product [Lepeophtheirus salmonis]